MIGVFGDLLEEVYDVDDFVFFMTLDNANEKPTQQVVRGKYTPAQMAPGEIERQLHFSSEYPGVPLGSRKDMAAREAPLTERIDAASILELCKQVVAPCAELDVDAFINFVDEALEHSDLQSSLVDPIIDCGRFYTFAIREFRKGKQMEQGSPMSPTLRALHSPAPAPAGVSSSSGSQGTVAKLRREIHHRIEQINQRRDSEDTAGVHTLEAEVNSRLRMLSMLGVPEGECADLVFNMARSPDYLRTNRSFQPSAEKSKLKISGTGINSPGIAYSPGITYM
eukprot:TRINITY_DN32576_c0_g1_i1.p1 TRINITY_DN32576_c0_g1~~TRINITY_DN32576_c0_g1_i1.p1  ORF type:complete len:281 (+),score=64.69 TRINITY_DN32576_c0_g1_i1:225-1067(+)